MSHSAILARALPTEPREPARLRRADEAGSYEGGFAGVWQNEQGATLALCQHGDDLTGTYVSTSSDGHGFACGDVTGACSGDLVSFTVRWRDFQAVTSWTGRLNDEKSMLNTMWLMIAEAQAEPEREDIHTGADRFTRLANIIHIPGLNG